MERRSFFGMLGVLGALPLVGMFASITASMRTRFAANRPSPPAATDSDSDEWGGNLPAVDPVWELMSKENRQWQ